MQRFLKSEPRINISQKLLIKILGASISFIRVHKNQEHLSRYIRDQNLTERKERLKITDKKIILPLSQFKKYLDII